MKAAATGTDVPNHIGLYLIDRPILAQERVRLVGEPVAAVIAIMERRHLIRDKGGVNHPRNLQYQEDTRS